MRTQALVAAAVLAMQIFIFAVFSLQVCAGAARGGEATLCDKRHDQSKSGTMWTDLV